MTKPELDLGIEVIKYTFDKLPSEYKLRVVEDLERQTRRQRWGQIISKVRSRVKENPISQRKINIICEEVRQQLYAKGNKGRN